MPIEVGDLTPEQQMLGQIYAWLHRRAEYLRAQQAQAETGNAAIRQGDTLLAKNAETESSQPGNDSKNYQSRHPSTVSDRE